MMIYSEDVSVAIWFYLLEQKKLIYLASQNFARLFVILSLLL